MDKRILYLVPVVLVIGLFSHPATAEIIMSVGNFKWNSDTAFNGILDHANTAERTYTFPDLTGTITLTSGAQTLSSKSIDADTNTLTNIENADIKAGANINAVKIGTGVVDTTEFNSLDGVSGSAVDDGANIGTGTGTVFSSKVGNDLQFKTLRSGDGITLTNYANNILVNSTGGVTTLESLTNVTDGGCATGQVRKVSGANWVCANDSDTLDNLGNHLATTTLDMAGFNITNIGGTNDPSAGNLRFPFNALLTFTNSSGNGYGILTFNTTNRGGQFSTSHDLSIGQAGCRPNEYCQNADLWLDTQGLIPANTATGIITMRSYDESDDVLVDYTKIEFFNSDTTDNIQDGRMVFSAMQNGAYLNLLELNGESKYLSTKAAQFTFSPSDSHTIAGGVITPTTPFILVDTEGAAATDDIDTITTPTSGGGTILVVVAASSARTVVMKDATGNLDLSGDFSLDNVQDTIMLIYDSSSSRWKEISESDNGA